jgi:uncharacterized protein
MQVEMVVAGLTIDPVNNAPIVILREKQSDRVLPIWIGVIEASAIAFELEKVKLTRPMAHDLMKSAVQKLGGTVERVAVVDLRDNTYYAIVVLAQHGKTMELDARPSDAVALALRTGAPIFCESRVIEMAQARSEATAAAGGPGAQTITGPGSEDDVDKGEGGPRPIVAQGTESFRELLESLEPEAFGKYKM